MLCVKEIFRYLDENLKLTTQALSDKATPMDELEDMHRRVCFTSSIILHLVILSVRAPSLHILFMYGA
jgi:E3 ubiquitin-protein ligase listerin